MCWFWTQTGPFIQAGDSGCGYFRACWHNAYSWPLWKINTALSSFVVVSLWNIMNIIVAEHWLLSCWRSAWKKWWSWTKPNITFSNKGVETAWLETTDSSFNRCLVLWTVCGQGWPSQTQTPPLNIYSHRAIPSALCKWHSRAPSLVCYSGSKMARL